MADTWIPLKGPDGEVREFHPEDAAKAKAEGWGSASAEDIHRARLRTEYDSPKGMAIAAGTSALSMATLGASDQLAEMTGNKTAVATSREVNPGSSAVGSVAGIAAPVLGELGATRALAGAARAGVESLLPAAMETNALGRIAKAGIGMAAESLPFTAQEIVSESALGDPKEVASHLWSKVGTNALLFGGLGVGGKAVAEGVKPAWDGIKEASQKVADTFDRYYPKAASALTGEPEADVAQRLAFRGKEGAEAVAPDTDSYIRDMTSSINEARGKAKQVVKDLSEIRDTAKDELLNYAPVQGVKSQMADISKTMGERIDALKAAPDDYMAPHVKGMDSALGNFQTRVSTATTPAEMHDAATAFKEALQDIGSKSPKMAATAGERDAIFRARQMSKDVAGALEDRGVWGEMGEVTGKYNRVYSNFKRADDALMKAVGEDLKLGKGVEASPRRIATWLKGGEGSANDLRKELFQRWVDAHGELADVGDDLAGRISARVGDFDRDGLRALLERNQDAAKRLFGAKDEVSAFKAAQQGEAGMSRLGKHEEGPGWGALGFGLEALGHHTLGGIALGMKVAKGAYNLLTRPELAALRLGQIETVLQKASKVLDGAVDRLVSASPKLVTAGARTIGGAVLSVKEVDNLKRQASDPQALIDGAAKLSGNLSQYAPAIASALAAQHGQAAQYLASVAPKTTMDTPFGPVPVKPSAQEMQKFSAIVDVVRDPTKLMDHLANGTATTDLINAVRATHPEVFQAQQTRLTQKLAGMTPKQRNAIPHFKKTAMSAFLGLPIDSSFKPQNMTSTLGMYAQRSQPSRAPKASGAMMKVGIQSQTRMTSRRSSRLGL
jgi:hypothetical protein